MKRFFYNLLLLMALHSSLLGISQIDLKQEAVGSADVSMSRRMMQGMRAWVGEIHAQVHELLGGKDEAYRVRTSLDAVYQDMENPLLQADNAKKMSEDTPDIVAAISHKLRALRLYGDAGMDGKQQLKKELVPMIEELIGDLLILCQDLKDDDAAITPRMRRCIEEQISSTIRSMSYTQ